VVCVTTGAVLEVAMAAFTTSEWRLARQLYATPTDDVVVADSAYGTYVDLALVRSAKAMPCFGNIMRVSVIFASVRSWDWRSYCPVAASSANPQSMSAADFQRYQQALKCGSAFVASTTRVSSQEIILVTTLVDPKRYSKARLAQLYQLRWQATEVNFKHLKTTLKMEMILKTPEMVQKKSGCICCVQHS